MIRCAILLPSLCLLCGCRNADTADTGAIPPPVAYPRLPLTEADSMTVVDGLPLPLRVSNHATYSLPQGDLPSMTVTYPAAGADIYYTLIPVGNEAERNRIVEARQERFSLNLNGATARTIHASAPDGTQAIILVATTGSQTPVQMLADTPDYIITATAFVHDPRAVTAYDSIRPLIDILTKDMSRSLPNPLEPAD